MATSSVVDLLGPPSVEVKPQMTLAGKVIASKQHFPLKRQLGLDINTDNNATANFPKLPAPTAASVSASQSAVSSMALPRSTQSIWLRLGQNTLPWKRHTQGA
jgi:hypothetical protein